jgi:hypothetical protein
MGKATVPTSHEWIDSLLIVRYEPDVEFCVSQIQTDRLGRLWAEVVAKVGEDVANQARFDLLDQRQRVDFEALAHQRDGRVDWQPLLVPVIALAQEGPGQAEPQHRPGTDDRWPRLDIKALHGLAGTLTMAIDPYTEADHAAVLLNLLAAFGNVVGSGPYFRVEHTKHPLRLFTVLVGDTAKGRKGTSWSTPRHIFRCIDEAWVRDQVSSGLSSGEGLIYHVRDKRAEKQPVKNKGRVVDYEEVIVDHGVDDKRLLIIEEEFAQALKVMTRQGNILSTTLRQAWDDGNLHPLTKSNPIRATDAHISIIGHITSEELLRHLDSTEMANGFANRFLWAMVRRSKVIPNPVSAPESILNPLTIRLHKAIEAARNITEMRRDADAEDWWEARYGELSERQPGLFGAITGRAEAQVMRLGAIYAALDGTGLISCEHLEAALAVWRYCEESARYVFGDNTGDPVADKILHALREQGPLPRSSVNGALGHNVPAEQIEKALALLMKHSRITIEEVRRPQGGRPLTLIAIAGHTEKYENNEIT